LGVGYQISDIGYQIEEAGSGYLWIWGEEVHLPDRGEEAKGGTQAALLVFVVGTGGTLADGLVALGSGPTVESSFQGICLRSHESGRPQKGLALGVAHISLEIRFAGASEDHESAWVRTNLAQYARNLKVHERVVTHINKQIRGAGDTKSGLLIVEGERKRLLAKTGGGCKKLRNSVANLSSVIGIGNEDHLRVVTMKDTALQH